MAIPINSAVAHNDSPKSESAESETVLNTSTITAAVNTMNGNNISTGNEKRKTSRRANTAERRATHNAVERQRRETLNGRFLDLAALLPNLSSVRRPSKSAIVNSSIAALHAGRRQRYIAARELRTLYTQFLALKSECDEWRSRAGVQPIGEDCERNQEFRRLVEMDLSGKVYFEEMSEEERGALRMAACAGAGGKDGEHDEDEDGAEGEHEDLPPPTPITPAHPAAAAMQRKNSSYSATSAPAQPMNVPMSSHTGYYDHHQPVHHGYYPHPPGSAGGYPPHPHHSVAHPHVGSFGSDYSIPSYPHAHGHGHPGMINTALHHGHVSVNGPPHTPLYGPVTPPSLSLPTLPYGGMPMKTDFAGSYSNAGAPNAMQFPFDDSASSGSPSSIDGARSGSPASISLAPTKEEEVAASTAMPPATGGPAFTNVAMGIFW